MPQTTFTSIRLAIIVSLGGFIFGFDASVISGVVGFTISEFGLNEWQQGFVVSSPTLGAVLASLAAGPLSDQIGRKKVLLAIAFLYLLSAAASAFATSYYMLISARFIGGLAFASLVLAPVYIAEISPAHLRGRLVAINQLNIVVGFSAAYFSNFLILRMSGSDAGWVNWLGIDDNTWRWMLGIETLPALCYFLLLFTIPESPRWLVVKNRLAEAKEVLGELVSADQIDQQLKEIQHGADHSQESFTTRLKFLLDKRVRLALVVGVIVGIAQQATGVNAIYFYAPSIFEQSGVGTDAAFAQAIWVGIINVVFTLIAMALVDKLGRKPVLLAGLVGVMVSMGACAWGFSEATYQLTIASIQPLQDSINISLLQPIVGQLFTDDVSFKQALEATLGTASARAHEGALLQAAVTMNTTLVLFGILGFVASFAISLGPVMWILLSEIFPNHIRGIAISAVSFINAAVSFTVQLVFPWELLNLGTAMTFLIYGSFGAAGFILVAWLLPETKGRSLEQLEDQFAASAK
ncbi:hypothetical protein GCM10011369_14240 [Neiella marina]|uniref:Major facilitator superfamily (MFS) profile domain-containing protein n=1 Tax=Neiella marina TaxID=508461 RepID=A0A8J2U4C2_9GAMM|nr:sugar porter family MFS transporter [Neiella marina]GGA73619.1 hypothetical protein GCM10011369_14240 [Neiella marina]